MSTQLPPPRQNGQNRLPAQDAFKELRAQLNSAAFRQRIAGGVPEEFRTTGYIDRLVESIFIACRDNKDLLDRCDRASLFRAAERIAKKGLTVGDNVAWLVPYKGQVQDQLGFKGAMIQVRRSKAVTRITAQPVYSADKCEILLGTEQRIDHKPVMSGDRGQFIGVYAVAWVDGQPEIEWMSASEVEKIRGNSPSANSPAWRTWPTEMARAKVLKRLCKRLPTERPIDLDDMDEAGAQAIEGSAETIDFDTPADEPQGQATISAPVQEPMAPPPVAHDPLTGEIREPERVPAQPKPQPRQATKPAGGMFSEDE